MMEREQFDRVWRRVSVGMEETDEVSKLRREIREATVLLGAYELLRSRQWREGESLRREKQAELRLLQSEYFLMTGERCEGERLPGEREATLLLLRRAALGEERAAESYAAHAARSGSRGKEMYGELSRKARQRSERLRQAIRNSM